MNRDELLSRSREENYDERKEEVNLRAANSGAKLFVFLTCFFGAYNLYLGQELPNILLLGVGMAYWGSEEIRKYLFDKKWYSLILGITWSSLSVYLLLRYIIETLV